MSLVLWLGKANPSLAGHFPKPRKSFLRDPNEDDAIDALACASANEEIDSSSLLDQKITK